MSKTKLNKIDNFGGGFILGIICILIIILCFQGYTYIHKSHEKKVSLAENECYKQDMSYIDYQCKQIDISNISTVDKYVQQCYAICGYNIKDA